MGDPHQTPEKEAGERAEAIIRRAREELLAIDPGCDCVVLWAARVLLALDERVMFAADAHALSDLVALLELVQADRRIRLGLDRTTTDGALDIRAAWEGSVIQSVTVHVGNAIGGQPMPLAEALKLLREARRG